ncbi:hypothetical protein TK1879 [Thermococcus kodakarensis KOD1]|uniref:Uncharacterized protein n=1 Tax=Thermococcus kodakarensis (strain ATCC BAA-918 / JCM 12380 / KOD1) TaxID=69014 RepID=Q5JEN8_THEKO|nr:hypothetical protein [Thermococcus kodakarensis]WCN27782.1 hypothetical protein POG15_09570 [Thermococcus kodakarensis]WCN30076.1 hypothetical protein POG21_09555 [Thermococcus kodakarensis]BAD86068.1 hypothetical protein TK1879 [Thermococcus kodakarensis KOD1]
MLDTDIMVAKIGWSFNNWRGFDQEMFKNRLLYDFEYIRNTGFGHELWNFYEGFSKNNYFGHIEGNPANFTSGIVLFVSKFIDPRDPRPRGSSLYLVGLYGNAIYEPNGFKTGTRIVDLLPDYAVEHIENLVQMRSWKGKDPDRHLEYLERLLDGEEYTARLVASKKYSTAFIPRYNGYVEIDKTDIGVEEVKQWKFTYRIPLENALRLLDIAIFRHERIARNEVEESVPGELRKQAIEIATRIKRVKKILERLG